MAGSQFYDGPLTPSKMSKRARQGYFSFKAQKCRCKSVPQYAGIEVEYSVREFIGWWLLHISKKKHWNRPVTARIDHDKNYSFDNIVLQECSENSVERINRLGSPSWARKKRVRALNGDGAVIKEFKSVTDAANYFSVCLHTVKNHCTGKTKRPFRSGNRSGTGFYVRFEWSL